MKANGEAKFTGDLKLRVIRAGDTQKKPSLLARLVERIKR